MSKESAAGHNTEGKLPRDSQRIAIMGADVSASCCRHVYFSVSLCNKARVIIRCSLNSMLRRLQTTQCDAKTA